MYVCFANFCQIRVFFATQALHRLQREKFSDQQKKHLFPGLKRNRLLNKSAAISHWNAVSWQFFSWHRGSEPKDTFSVSTPLPSIFEGILKKNRWYNRFSNSIEIGLEGTYFAFDIVYWPAIRVSSGFSFFKATAIWPFEVQWKIITLV